MFRGMDDRSQCTRIFDAHVNPWQGIDYATIPAAQRPKDWPIPDEHVEKYKKTIRAANEQWGLTMEQLNSLTDMLEVLTQEEPIPFHWPADGIRVSPREPAPSDNQSVAESQGHSVDPEDDGERNGEPSFNFWDKQERDKHDKDPLLPFKLNDVVVIRNGKDPTHHDPFWLGEIINVNHPPPWTTVVGASQGDWLVQVQWFERKKGHVDKSWKEAKYEKSQSTEWIVKKAIHMNLVNGLTKTGLLRKKDPNDQLMLESFCLVNRELEEKSEQESDDDGKNNHDHGGSASGSRRLEARERNEHESDCSPTVSDHDEVSSNMEDYPPPPATEISSFEIEESEHAPSGNQLFDVKASGKLKPPPKKKKLGSVRGQRVLKRAQEKLSSVNSRAQSTVNKRLSSSAGATSRNKRQPTHKSLSRSIFDGSESE